MLKDVSELKVIRNKILKEDTGVTLEFTEYEHGVKALSLCQDNIPFIQGYPTDKLLRPIIEKSFENLVKQRKADLKNEENK